MTIVIARAVALLTLLTLLIAALWSLVGRTEVLPEWARIHPLQGLLLFLLAYALALLTTDRELRMRRVAMAVVVLGSIVLLSWMVTAAMDAAILLQSVHPHSVGGRLLAMRPPPVLTFGIVTLGASIAFRDRSRAQFDFSALLGTLAAGIFFLLCVGHLYGATGLFSGPARLLAPSTVLVALFLFAIAIASLALHEGGPLAVYAGEEPGAIAKRRLLPAAVLTPIASGFLLVYALDGQQLSPRLAVALTVFANVLVMLFLIDGAGNKVARIARDRQARIEARAALARKQNLRDPMTALLNRRGWDAEVQAAERRCRNEGLNACVIVIDLDGLKQVNDTEGHKAGDAYIRRAAHALRVAGRGGDALARLGGDEFAFLVVGCDESSARAAVLLFREALEEKKVSASVGFAMRNRRTVQQAFEEADQSMYQQKRARKLKRA